MGKVEEHVENVGEKYRKALIGALKRCGHKDSNFRASVHKVVTPFLTNTPCMLYLKVNPYSIVEDHFDTMGVDFAKFSVDLSGDSCEDFKGSDYNDILNDIYIKDISVYFQEPLNPTKEELEEFFIDQGSRYILDPLSNVPKNFEVSYIELRELAKKFWKDF